MLPAGASVFHSGILFYLVILKEFLIFSAKKVPILIFSGDNEGVIIKWERMQSNHFMYR